MRVATKAKTDRGRGERVAASNAVLSSYSTEQITLRDGRIVVSWPTLSGVTERQWLTRGSDFYPVWAKKYPHGGTRCTALSQLVRWIKGKPVAPIGTWLHWRQNGLMVSDDALDLLRDKGYPVQAKCVLCGIVIVSGFDWWHLGLVSGPCCRYHQGCRCGT